MEISKLPSNLTPMQNADDLRQQTVDLISKMRKIATPLSTEAMSSLTAQPTSSFSSMLSQAVKDINQLQNHAEGLRTAYELGDKSVSLSQVVLAAQAANVGFKFLLNMRNRAISAYKDIMSMPI